MAVQAPHAQSAPPKQGHGCLRGCLIASLVLVVALVVGGAATYFLGRAYIARRLPAWEARYPVVGLAADLLEIRGHLAEAGEQAQVAGGRLEGENDKSLVLADIPLYPDPLLETYSIAGAQVTAFQRLAATPDAVLARLRQVMPENGWGLASEQESESGRLLVWAKGERTCQTEVVAREETSELWLRCSDGASEAAPAEAGSGF